MACMRVCVCAYVRAPREHAPHTRHTYTHLRPVEPSVAQSFLNAHTVAARAEPPLPISLSFIFQNFTCIGYGPFLSVCVRLGMAIFFYMARIPPLDMTRFGVRLALLEVL